MGKKGSVAWFVSNCQTSSKREIYAKTLSKYLDVDIYGNCGTKKCSRTKGNACYEMIEKRYMFYLSFENSICKDYVTEKLFNALKFEIIPIVMGGADYDQILPQNSYINALNFSSPQYLAQYLKKVSSNYTLYKSYFEWKEKYYSSNNYWDPPFCDLCHKLNGIKSDSTLSVSKSMSRTKQLVTWWFNEGNCTSPPNSLLYGV
jgi:alpha-1,3-fucosyltransferase